jgi:hypothetical protein
MDNVKKNNKCILYLPGGTEEDHGELARIAGVRAEIPTKHFPNANVQRYRYNNLLGARRVKKQSYQLFCTFGKCGFLPREKWPYRAKWQLVRLTWADVLWAAG